MHEDLTTVPKAPGSALRHRPIMKGRDTQDRVVETARASRVKPRTEPYTADAIPSPASGDRRVPKRNLTRPVYLLLGMLCACLLLWVGQLLWSWGSTVSDDLRYGRPRTTQVDHVVGHESDDTPSHFVAMNLNGQIYVIEIPGGNPNASHLLVGPHLYGPGSDLAPITISFIGDSQHPDLLIMVSTIQVRFHNTGSGYAPTQ